MPTQYFEGDVPRYEYDLNRVAGMGTKYMQRVIKALDEGRQAFPLCHRTEPLGPAPSALLLPLFTIFLLFLPSSSPSSLSPSGVKGGGAPLGEGVKRSQKSAANAPGDLFDVHSFPAGSEDYSPMTWLCWSTLI